MKNVIVFLVVCVATYGGLRYFGVLGSDEPIVPGVESAGGPIETESTTSDPEPPPVNRGPVPESIRGAAVAIAEGKQLGDSRAELERVAKDPNSPSADLATRLLAIVGEDAKARWLAASRCARDTGLELELRDRFASKAVEFARAGVIGSTTIKHRVVKGDSLERICKQAAKERGIAVTPGMLRWVNGISGDRIKPNQELLIPDGAFRITVSKSRFVLDAWVGEGLVRRFRVAIGKDGKTPDETFKVEEKLEKPPWDDPTTGKRLHFGEPGYALGTRWIAFDSVNGHSGLGIHGTDDPASIGSAASLGCIRLANEDVEDLYALVPVGTVVEIRT